MFVTEGSTIKETHAQVCGLTPALLLFHCVAADIDECVDTAHDCDVNAECVNTPGSFDCICNSGHTGDGLLCSGTACTDTL